jgi:TRAP-type uncharacterized transport system fused permease subunit
MLSVRTSLLLWKPNTRTIDSEAASNLPGLHGIFTAKDIAGASTELGIQPLQAHMFIFYFSIISCITPPIAIAAYAAGAIAKTNPMDVGWEAVRVGVAAYLIPFIFVYQPVLLLEGSLWGIFIAGVSALLGIIALGCAVVGFLDTNLTVLERLSMIAGSIFLIVPGIRTDLIGVALALVPFVKQRVRNNRSKRDQEQMEIYP